MYLAEVRKVGSMMIRNLSKPRNQKNLFKFCKRKYSLKKGLLSNLFKKMTQMCEEQPNWLNQ